MHGMLPTKGEAASTNPRLPVSMEGEAMEQAETGAGYCHGETSPPAQNECALAVEVAHQRLAVAGGLAKARQEFTGPPTRPARRRMPY